MALIKILTPDGTLVHHSQDVLTTAQATNLANACGWESLEEFLAAHTAITLSDAP